MITNDKYNKFKNSINKTYSEKFKLIRDSSLLFSYFGNIISIFFAYFFFISLFSNIVYAINPYIISLSIIIFLGIFEYLKRYVFDLLVIEFLSKVKYTKQKITFLISASFLIFLSFFLSLTGSQKLVNNEKFIQEKNNYNIETKTDSINKYYMDNYISQYKTENIKLIEQQSELTNQQSNLINNKSNISRISSQLNTINNQINFNKESIIKYEKQRDDQIIEVKNKETNKLKNEKNNNSINIIYFILFSTLMEFIIIYGVFYNRYYEFRTISEYEEDTVNTLGYKNWKKYSEILSIIFINDIKINEYIQSSAAIMDLIEANDLKYTKNDLDICLKTLNHLGIIETKGPKRLLKISKKNSEETLKNYFNIK